MSAKKQTAKKAAAKAAAPKPAAKKTAAKAAAQAEAIVPDGTEVVFTGFAAPIQGVSELSIGDRLYITSRNEDDGSYNVAKTPKGIAVDTLFRSEFRLGSEAATAAETANAGKNGGAPISKATAKKLGLKGGTTDAEADAGTKTTGKAAKDKDGRTVVAAKPAKAPKPEPEPMAPVKLVGSAKTIAAEYNGDLVKAALILTERAESTDYTLGGVLAKIHETAAFEGILDAEGQPKYGTGHAGYGKFTELHLGMKYRKATYLEGIYTTCVRLGITEKQIAGIGWSKLKESLSSLTEENKDEILAEAKALPFDQFKAAMKKRVVNGGGKVHGNTNTADLTTFTFKLHNDKGQVLVEALDKAKTALGIEGTDVFTQSQALDHIVSEWLSMKD